MSCPSGLEGAGRKPAAARPYGAALPPYATRLVRDPAVDLVTAAAFLGHARLDTTARYSQPGEDDLAEAAERIWVIR